MFSGNANARNSFLEKIAERIGGGGGWAAFEDLHSDALSEAYVLHSRLTDPEHHSQNQIHYIAALVVPIDAVE